MRMDDGGKKKDEKNEFAKALDELLQEFSGTGEYEKYAKKHDDGEMVYFIIRSPHNPP